MLPVSEFLSGYAKARVFFSPVPGNNGDTLIQLGSREALIRAGVQLVEDPGHADLIVLNGGGWLTDMYPGPLDTMSELALGYSHTPLAVLPNTATLDVLPMLRDLVSHRTAPTFFYAREEYSYQALLHAALGTGVEVGLDHDMAFHLRESAWLEKQREQSCPQHALIVERTDPGERTSQASLSKPLLPPWISGAFPAWLHDAIRRLRASRHRATASDTPFAQQARRRFASPDAAELPVYAGDISEPRVCDFDEFTSLIARAGVVGTNRLHVAVMSAMLDKPTYLWPGVNHKIAGVYDYSLKTYPNVQLITST